MGGSSESDQKTTTQQLTPEQQALTQAAAGNYQQFAASNPTLPTGDQAVSPFDPLQTQGQNQVLGAVPQAADTVGTAANTNKEIASGAFLDPGSNPYVQNAVKAAVNPIYDNLTQRVLPGIGAGASTGAGGISANFGGSRQGIAEGLATKSADEAAGNAGAGILNQALQTGLGATNTAIAQAPTSAGSLSIPGTMTSTVGDVRQGQAQNVLNANNAASQLQQWLPLLKAQYLTQGASGLPGGSTVSTGTSNKDANPISQIIGGASAAGGLAGGLSNLLPLLAISDEGFKTKIKFLRMHRGHRWYEFEFVWGGPRREGVLAQEARLVTPGAVHCVGGMLAVDYSKIL